MADHEIKKFGSGVHNREDNEDTLKDSAKDALNWLTIDGRIELARGKVTVGAEGPARASTARARGAARSRGRARRVRVRRRIGRRQVDAFASARRAGSHGLRHGENRRDRRQRAA